MSYSANISLNVDRKNQDNSTIYLNIGGQNPIIVTLHLLPSLFLAWLTALMQKTNTYHARNSVIY